MTLTFSLSLSPLPYPYIYHHLHPMKLNHKFHHQNSASHTIAFLPSPKYRPQPRKLGQTSAHKSPPCMLDFSTSTSHRTLSEYHIPSIKYSPQKKSSQSSIISVSSDPSYQLARQLIQLRQTLLDPGQASISSPSSSFSSSSSSKNIYANWPMLHRNMKSWVAQLPASLKSGLTQHHFYVMMQVAALLNPRHNWIHALEFLRTLPQTYAIMPDLMLRAAVKKMCLSANQSIAADRIEFTDTLKQQLNSNFVVYEHYICLLAQSNHTCSYAVAVFEDLQNADYTFTMPQVYDAIIVSWLTLGDTTKALALFQAIAQHNIPIHHITFISLSEALYPESSIHQNIASASAPASALASILASASDSLPQVLVDYIILHYGSPVDTVQQYVHSSSQVSPQEMYFDDGDATSDARMKIMNKLQLPLIPIRIINNILFMASNAKSHSFSVRLWIYLKAISYPSSSPDIAAPLSSSSPILPFEKLLHGHIQVNFQQPNHTTFYIIAKVLAQTGQIDSLLNLLSLLPQRFPQHSPPVGAYLEWTMTALQVNQRYLHVLTALETAFKAQHDPQVFSSQPSIQHSYILAPLYNSASHKEGYSITIHAYNIAIYTLFNAQDYRRAFHLYRNLYSHSNSNLHPDFSTFHILLKALRHLGSWKIAELILQDMDALGVPWDITTCNFVLQTYSKSGQWEKATTFLRGMFQRQGCDPDLVSYTACVLACEKAARWREALAFLVQMGQFGFSPNPLVCDACISACAKSRKWNHIITLFTEMQNAKLRPSLKSFNYCAHALLKSYKPNRAFQLLENMHTVGLAKNVVSYNIQMNIKSTSIHWRDVFALFARMTKHGIPPNRITYTTLIKACARNSRLKQALRILQKMKDSGIQLDYQVYGACINAAQQKGRLDICISLLREMQSKEIPANVIVFNSCISACQKDGDLKMSLALFQEMQTLGIRPDIVTYGACLTTIRKSKDGSLEACLQLMSQMEFEGIKPDAACYNACIGACKGIYWAIALKLHSKMMAESIQPNVVTFTSVISACERQAKWISAIKQLRIMQRMQIHPNIYTYNSCISACARAQKTNGALALFDELLEMGLSPDVITFNSVINACEKDRRWKTGLELLEVMKKEKVIPDIVTYNSLMSACGKCGQLSIALNLLQEAKNVGLKPNVISFTSCIHACEIVGDQENALKLLQEMRQLNIPPNALTYSSIIRSLEKRDDHKTNTEISRLVESLKYSRRRILP